MQAPGLLSSSSAFSISPPIVFGCLPSACYLQHNRLSALQLPEFPIHCCFTYNRIHGPRRSFHHSAPAAFSSLGFTADPRGGIERAANGLLKDAASLLLYQEVLRSPPAQAFLKVIVALSRGEDGWKLLEAYGEFYRLMAIGHFSSWEDFILEGMLAGEVNPFAEASANVGNPRSNWSQGVPVALQAAAAADLDSMQRLSITESTLVGWVTDLVPDVRPEWRVAAESSLNSRNIRKTSAHTADGRELNCGLGFSKSDDLPMQPAIAVEKSEDATFKGCKIDDAISSDREVWRKRIGGLWRWSEAVPLLEKYYAEFGVGKVAGEQVLQCKGGKLLRDSNLCTFKNSWNLSIHHAHHEKLRKFFERHASHSAAGHILVCGPSGSGKTWLVNSILLKLAFEGKVKVVFLPKNEIKYLQGVLEELERNWQLRFVLVADSISVISDLLFVECPENVLLCVTSPIRNSLRAEESDNKKLPPAGEYHDIFGIILTLDNLVMESFLLCVEDILKCKEKLGIAIGIRESIMMQAVSWANKREILSVRSVAQFIKSIL